ncbi:MAG: hypothetical protein ABEJ88_08125 [Halobacterium sp.]
MTTGRFTRAQLVAGFWALFGFYMAGTGVKNYLADGLGFGAVGYLVLGVGGAALAAVYLRNPDQVPDGRERVDKRVEAAVAFALVFVAVVTGVVLFG